MSFWMDKRIIFDEKLNKQKFLSLQKTYLMTVIFLEEITRNINLTLHRVIYFICALWTFRRKNGEERYFSEIKYDKFVYNYYAWWTAPRPIINREIGSYVFQSFARLVSAMSKLGTSTHLDHFLNLAQYFSVTVFCFSSIQI